MLAKLSLALIGATLLASCAATNGNGNGNGAMASSRGAKTYYCATDQLKTVDEGLSCNWEDNPASACRSFNSTTLKKGTVAGTPRAAGMCSTGGSLVAINAS